MESSGNKERRNSSILKQSKNYQQHKEHNPDHVHFDEQIIQEHDQDRGTRIKIDEPKTPYEEYDEQSDQNNNQDANMQDISDQNEEEVKKHLEEAEKNKFLNAQLQKDQQIQDLCSNLTDKLEQTQNEQDEEEKKHQEFLMKRKQHYKNEINPAKLLKQASLDEEDDDK